MAGTKEGGEKAAQTRKEKDPQAFQKMGSEGAIARHAKTREEESRIAQKAAATRKERDPDAFRKMGQIGGSHSRRGPSSGHSNS